MNNFCTLFDLRYLSRGLALYESLKRNASRFHLYVLAMDEGAEKLLKELALPHLTVIPLQAIEAPDLLGAKKTRTRQEYCWTCTPAIVRHCIRTFDLDLCTYVDADTFFFDDPQILLKQLGNKAVFITPHFYAPEYDQTKASGIYCVQFTAFKNNAAGMRVLDDWYEKCIDWCFARIENGRFGDQKYLDEWPERFGANVIVSGHPGGGVAPWNLKNYDLAAPNNRLIIRNILSGERHPVIFYHFHDFHFREDGMWHHKSGPFGYEIGEDAYDMIYRTYIETLYTIGKKLKFRRGIDFPSLPKTLTRFDFERVVIPRLRSFRDRDLLRQAYHLKGEEYHFNPDSNQKRDQIFSTMLEVGLNLSAVTLWESPNNVLQQQLEYFRGRLRKIESNLFFKLLLSLYRKLRGN